MLAPVPAPGHTNMEGHAYVEPDEAGAAGQAQLVVVLMTFGWWCDKANDEQIWLQCDYWENVAQLFKDHTPSNQPTTETTK